MSKVPMTKYGAQKLRQELEQLKTVERPRIIAAIAEARAHGDLKENAEYHAAREQQGFVEGRIKEIEAKLSNAQVIDATAIENVGKVIFGVTVEIENIETGQTISYQIVGEDEADIKQKKVSVTSPIARALIGKLEGDLVQVKVPDGIVEYEIIEVQHI
ncbi:MAG: transcription elongation factor GreA [Pseudomonadales bacterium]|nr:transcription elongation factor GreA [Pseudomonadales bacterium]